nr:uncharacterized protein CFP56_04033 [Quercus suber]
MASPTNIDWTKKASISEEETRTRAKLPKKLIVCCDGTWQDSDNADANPTNVTRITRAISSEDDHHHPQIVYYQAGIGTGMGLVSQIAGGATGLGLAVNVREAYAFLASNYAENSRLCDPDSIFLLGFSRGAYTARSLGGFICALGILKKHAMPHFVEIFSDWENAGDPAYHPQFFDSYFEHHHDVKKVKPDEGLAKDKNRRDEYIEDYYSKLLHLDLTQNVAIKALGVWDTVGALGIPVNPVLQRMFWFLPAFIRGNTSAAWFDTRLDKSGKILNAFHALGLDERRFPYSPAVWERDATCPTNLKQVWFPGAHSNVGGSYADAGTADITLAWMMDQMSGNTMDDRANKFRAKDWIKFDEEYISQWYDCQLDWYNQHKAQKYRNWAMGKVYDSLTFPQSLAGSRIRRPGHYHKTDYESGRTIYNRPLQHTNEHVHASVRVRIDMAGSGMELDDDGLISKVTAFLRSTWLRIWNFGRAPPSLYQPQRRGGPLHGWSLRDGHAHHFDPNRSLDVSHTGLERIAWVYDGPAKLASSVMPEDKLGKYEMMLLQKDEQLASQVVFTNNGWQIRPKQPAPLPSLTQQKVLFRTGVGVPGTDRMGVRRPGQACQQRHAGGQARQIRDDVAAERRAAGESGRLHQQRMADPTKTACAAAGARQDSMSMNEDDGGLNHGRFQMWVFVSRTESHAAEGAVSHGRWRPFPIHT